MERVRNVTLSLPEGLLVRAKVVAARQATSLSQLMRTSLERTVVTSERYEGAQERALARLAHGFEMRTTSERYQWNREALHERS